MSDVTSIRAEIKAWERSFKETNGRQPTIDDIKKQPTVAQKYKLYKKLSKAATISSGLTSRLNDPPSTPPRATPSALKPPKLLKSAQRVAETTAPLASFNPFSPQKKDKGKQKETIPFNLPKPAVNPFASPRKSKAQSSQREVSPDSFPVIQPAQPSTSTQLKEPPSAVSRARKRLRGEPVSPSPSKEKRQRVLSSASPPFPKLQLQGLGNDDSDGGDEGEDNDPDGGNSSFVDDSPMKPVVNGKAFTALFEETVKPTSTTDLFGGDVLNVKSQPSNKRPKNTLPNMDDDVFSDESKIKSNTKSSTKSGPSVKSQHSTLPKSRSKLIQTALPIATKLSNGAHKGTSPEGRISTKRVLSELELGPHDTTNSDTASTSSPDPSNSTFQLLPPSPNPNASRPSGKSKPNSARSHQPPKATSRKKAKLQNGDDDMLDDMVDDMTTDDGSSSDGFNIQQSVKLVHHSRGIRALLPTEGGNSEVEDPILNYAKCVQPRGNGLASPVKQGSGNGIDAVLDEEDGGKDMGFVADDEKVGGNLPNELRRVLVLESLKSKKNEYEEERIVKGLLSGRRVVHYDPRKGGEIWGVGEDNRDEFAEDEEGGIDEEADEWEGDPVPWEVGELSESHYHLEEM